MARGKRAAPKPAGADKGVAAAPAGLVAIVTGPKKGRWRAGRFFTSEPVSIPLAELSEDDQAALLGDPRLSVETREAD